MTGENEFIAFQCEHCHTSIEASADMSGVATECPACGARIVIPAPAAPGEPVRHSMDDAIARFGEAAKSRTIRIELGDL